MSETPLRNSDWEDDGQVCIDDYPEHDYRVLDESDGIRTLECRRCGAESWELTNDG